MDGHVLVVVDDRGTAVFKEKTLLLAVWSRRRRRPGRAGLVCFLFSFPSVTNPMTYTRAHETDQAHQLEQEKSVPHTELEVDGAKVSLPFHLVVAVAACFPSPLHAPDDVLAASTAHYASGATRFPAVAFDFALAASGTGHMSWGFSFGRLRFHDVLYDTFFLLNRDQTLS